MMVIERKVFPRVQSKNSYSNKSPTRCVLLRKWFDVLIQLDLFLLLVYYSYIKGDSFRLPFYIVASKYGVLVWQTPLSLPWERSLLTFRAVPSCRVCKGGAELGKSRVSSAALSWDQSQWPARSGPALRVFHPPACQRVHRQCSSSAGSNTPP